MQQLWTLLRTHRDGKIIPHMTSHTLATELSRLHTHTTRERVLETISHITSTRSPTHVIRFPVFMYLMAELMMDAPIESHITRHTKPSPSSHIIKNGHPPSHPIRVSKSAEVVTSPMSPLKSPVRGKKETVIPVTALSPVNQTVYSVA